MLVPRQPVPTGAAAALCPQPVHPALGPHLGSRLWFLAFWSTHHRCHRHGWTGTALAHPPAPRIPGKTHLPVRESHPRAPGEGGSGPGAAKTAPSLVPRRPGERGLSAWALTGGHTCPQKAPVPLPQGVGRARLMGPRLVFRGRGREFGVSARCDHFALPTENCREGKRQTPFRLGQQRARHRLM